MTHFDVKQIEHATRPATSRQGTAAPSPVPPPKREKFIGFAKDAETAALLHGAFAAHLPEGSQIHIMDFRRSLDILTAMTTPEIVLVDLTGEDQPINAVMELAEAVEPGTSVLAIGEVHNVNFYRTVTKGLGIKEYLFKPLGMAQIEKNFLPVIANHYQAPQGTRGGRLVTVNGARGGVGTSTIAANLAWLIGDFQHRHTVLIDGDLHTGTVALNLNVEPNNGLGSVLASPNRVDKLLIERSTMSGGDRLCVLAGQESLERDVDYHPDSTEMLIQTLRARYNFVVADAGARLTPFARDLNFSAQQRVIVLDPTMVSIRNLERLLTLPAGPSQSPRVMTVLNKAGTPGGLSQSYMEQVMGLRFDAVIPDLPRIVPKTTQYGEQAAALRGPFRTAILTLAQALGATSLQEAG
jgi:pilus assembly protein CpaE